MSVFFAVPRNKKIRFVWFRECGKVCGGFYIHIPGHTIECFPQQLFIYSSVLKFSLDTHNYKLKFHTWRD
jgi:hypothetical protein